jgi:hypothetical protein
MGIAEMVLIMSLTHGEWKMTDDHIPQLCLPAIEDESQIGGKAETFCAAVPEELLREWLQHTHIKA